MKKDKMAENRNRILADAFAQECNSRTEYLFFAEQAEKEGHREVAELFREVANFRETAHARGHFMRMKRGDTKLNLESALRKEIEEHAVLYTRLAKKAKDMGDEEVAKWFEGLARAEEGHALKFRKALKKFR